MSIFSIGSPLRTGGGYILSQNVSLQDTGDDGQTHDYEYFISV